MPILGADKSGRSLLAAMLNCSPDVDVQTLCIPQLSHNAFREQELQLLDALHASHSLDQKFIWIIRNPLESSCSMKKSGIPQPEALQYWADINTIIWYFLQSVPKNRQMMVHFESLLLNDSLIRNVFDFFGIIFHEQYLYYGDFDQFSFDDFSFQKGARDGEKVNFYSHDEESKSSWNKIKNKEVIMQFGYTRSL